MEKDKKYITNNLYILSGDSGKMISDNEDLW